MIFDQYNFDVSIGQTKAVDEFFSSYECEIISFPITWKPNNYIKKIKSVMKYIYVNN